MHERCLELLTIINFDNLVADELRAQFASALPLQYVVVDASLHDIGGASACFPMPDWKHWSALAGEYEKNKFYCRDLSVFPDRLRGIVHELTSPRFLELLEEITGIKALIPDPHLEGGGLHLSTEGGILAPHTDFHIYGRLNLYRQLNVILYLNETWESGDGGTLRLWDGHRARDDRKEARIDPLPGRMVIFKTDDRSVHGFTDPVAAGCTRKSIALYYYTAIDNEVFSGDFTTFWRHDHIGGNSSTRLFAYRLLLETSRAFSFLAHLVNPQLGLRWWRTRRVQRQ